MRIFHYERLAGTLKKTRLAFPFPAVLLIFAGIPACSGSGSSSSEDDPNLADTAAAVSTNCSALTSSPIFQVINPTNNANLLTASQSEASNAASSYGFTVNHGTPFYASVNASAASANGLVGAHRMYNSKNSDFFWTISSSEITSAVQTYGYVDQGINFYVSASAASCTLPVYRFVSGNTHRFAVSQADRGALTASGWKSEGIMFYGGVPADAGTVDPDPGTPPEGAGSAPVGSSCPAGAAVRIDATMTPAAIQSAISAQSTGATICFTSGRYRLTAALSPKSGQVLHGEPDAVLTGAVLLPTWTADGTAWRASGVALSSLSNSAFSANGSQASYEQWCEDQVNHPCSYANDVFYDGKPLTRVTARANVTSGTFYTDYANKVVYVGSQPAGHVVELATADAAVRVANPNVTIEGLTVEMFSQAADRGEIEINPGVTGATVQNCEARYAHGSGVLSAADGTRVLYNKIHDNGQLGVAVSGSSGAVVDHNDVLHNNIDGFWRIDGAAGGIKVDLATKVSITHNLVRNNVNHGIWFDEGANNATVTNNVVDNNFAAGIVFEVSSGAYIADNEVTNNGLLDSTARGHETCSSATLGCSGGIQIGNGASVEIARNTLVGNVHGISIVQTQGRTPRTNAYTIPNTTNVNVHDNVITLGTGLNGLVFNKGNAPPDFDPYASASGNVFVNNTYHLTSPGVKSFYWQNAAVNSTTWQGYGLDVTGVFLSP